MIGTVNKVSKNLTSSNAETKNLSLPVCTCSMYFIICKFYVSTSIPLLFTCMHLNVPCELANKFNRIRNTGTLLDHCHNYQIVVCIDIVDFLEPRYLLMENVVHVFNFARGLFRQYASSPQFHKSYQSNIGMMVTTYYKLPQFRIRVFLCKALPIETC